MRRHGSASSDGIAFAGHGRIAAGFNVCQNTRQNHTKPLQLRKNGDTDMLTLNQLRQLQRETFVAAIEYHEQLASTNDRAIELANDPAQKRPTLIVARDQTAGRGRGSNQWWSRAGALTFSLLLNGAEIGDQRRSWPLVSLSMGVAICDAIKAHCPDLKVGLKWPNDVYISGRRVNAPYLERNGASP